MSLSNSLAGGKVESVIHEYFIFLPDKGEKGKSKCNECGLKLSGKNSSSYCSISRLVRTSSVERSPTINTIIASSSSDSGNNSASDS
jgi:hypothetical protein